MLKGVTTVQVISSISVHGATVFLVQPVPH